MALGKTGRGVGKCLGKCCQVRTRGGVTCRSSTSGRSVSFSTTIAVDDLSHIQKLWLELREVVSYLSSEELEEVRNALQIAYGAHKGQKRKSGEPYIIHPVAVAIILGELHMDASSIIAGLLHDVVEDTDKLTFQDIESIFGEGVRHIVEGETKVSKLKESNGSLHFSKNDKKHIDMQQLFIAMTKEIRIIIVKLADRLHNMRTLEHMRPHKQKKIANETLTIFAPLANLLGLRTIQDKLETLSFKYSQPEEYKALSARIKALKMEQGPVVYEARQALLSVLKDDPVFQQIADDIDIRLANRSLYNIHKKLKFNDLQFRDLQNISQLHIIVTPRKDLVAQSDIADGRVSAVDRQVCYYLLGKVHEIWAPIPGKFKDFIATPKGNNYQCLHTTVIPLGSQELFPLEIQVRTEVMNLLAEKGYAAHRRLVDNVISSNGSQKSQNGNGNHKKNGAGGNGHSRDFYTQEGLWQAGWLNAVKGSAQELEGSAQEYVETVVDAVEGLTRSIFVFAPDGTLVQTPRGATIVDFAYTQDIGNQMLMAKVNGVPTHPSHELKLAEVVEIVTHKGPVTEALLKRQSEYLTYAKSRSTRNKIVKFLRENQTEKSIKSAMKKTYSDDNLADIMSTPYQKGEVLWLILRCNDEVGLLASVASIISSSGLSIRAYSGSVNDYSSIFLMNFELIGNATPEQLTDLCESLVELKAITSFAMGCNIV